VGINCQYSLHVLDCGLAKNLDLETRGAAYDVVTGSYHALANEEASSKGQNFALSVSSKDYHNRWKGTLGNCRSTALPCATREGERPAQTHWHQAHC
jgi:hypothetical protein